MFKAIAFSLLLMVGSLCLSCSPHPQPKDEAVQQKREDLRQQVLHMSSKYGADLEWMKILQRSRVFTLEIQQLLLEPPGQSYLLLAPVVDVLKREDVYFITSRVWLSDIYFQLECDEKQAQYILNTSPNQFRMLFNRYAIVMEPNSIHKPVAQLRAKLDETSAYITHDSADIIVVNGVCVDILSLDDSGLNLDDFLGFDWMKRIE